MRIQLHRRAEIALRSLSGEDKERVIQGIAKLEQYDGKPNHNIRQLQLHGDTKEAWYSFRATNQLRILFTKDNDTIIVRDISNIEKMGRLLGQRLP